MVLFVLLKRSSQAWSWVVEFRKEWWFCRLIFFQPKSFYHPIFLWHCRLAGILIRRDFKAQQRHFFPLLLTNVFNVEEFFFNIILKALLRRTGGSQKLRLTERFLFTMRPRFFGQQLSVSFGDSNSKDQVQWQNSNLPENF